MATCDICDAYKVHTQCVQCALRVCINCLVMDGGNNCSVHGFICKDHQKRGMCCMLCKEERVTFPTKRKSKPIKRTQTIYDLYNNKKK
jgi:hypothetical protein